MRCRCIIFNNDKYIMSNIGTTSLDELPIGQQGGYSPVQQPPPNLGESQNIKIENYGQQLNAERGNGNGNGNDLKIDYTSQLTSSLREASAAGATVLPSRDIPQSTLQIQHDDAVKPNFIPTNNSNDYIGSILDRERIINENNKRQNQSDNIDYIYQQIQIPIIVGILYFLFQLPIFRKQVLSFLPSLFNKDGNPKLAGYIFNSVMFASLYGIVAKTAMFF